MPVVPFCAAFTSCSNVQLAHRTLCGVGSRPSPWMVKSDRVTIQGLGTLGIARQLPGFKLKLRPLAQSKYYLCGSHDHLSVGQSMVYHICMLAESSPTVHTLRPGEREKENAANVTAGICLGILHFMAHGSACSQHSVQVINLLDHHPINSG